MESVKKNILLFSICAKYFSDLQKLLIICLQKYYRLKQERRRRFIKSLLRKIKDNYMIHSERNRIIYGEVLLNIPKKKIRKIWSKKRSKHWWYSIVGNKEFDDQMIENFRMDRQSFQYICERLYPELKPNFCTVREALSVDMVVAIAIYKLASCAEYRVVANQFGVHKSTVQKCLYRFCNAMIKIFLKEEIKIPTGDEATKIINGFKNKSGIPQILGAIDGTHIPVTAPADGHADYINRKGWTSIILQALVDCNYRFLDIACKHPGSCHDATVLKDSFFYKNIEQLKLPKDVINGIEIPVFFIGDPAYPLHSWLIKGYSGIRTEKEDSFNAYLNKARIVVENAFGRLKGRWRILQKRIDLNIDFVPKVVAVTCILHNILEKRKSPYRESWNESVRTANEIFIQPLNESQMFTLQGEEIRNHLADYMAQNFPLIKSIKN